jgi:hypothetical protein
MANVQYIEAGYTIPANTAQLYTFWWPGGGSAKAYFDVSVMPLQDPEHPNRIRLRETRREKVHIVDGGQQRYELWLTLQNEENFPVNFIANHVHIS